MTDSQIDSPHPDVRRPVSPSGAAEELTAPRTAETVDLAADAVRVWRLPIERTLVATLLVGVALVRMVGLGQLEPNVSAAEAANLAAIESLLADQGLNVFGRLGLGASGLALVPPILLRLVRSEPELALRLYAAIGSVAFIGLFYVLCRTRYPPVVSLATTALLAFTPWSIFFGRNGELSVFAGIWAVVAAITLQHALNGGGPVRWLVAGGATTAGLYWHPSAVWLLPALTVPIIWLAVSNRAARPRLIVALCVFVAAGLLVAAPRVPGLLAGPISSQAMLADEGATPAAAVGLRTRTQHLIRAFFLLDQSVTGDAQYQPAASAPLDGLTGVLLLGGLGLAAWSLTSRGPHSHTLPLALFLVPLVGSQLANPRLPALSDAVVALPGLYLLVADALARLLIVLPFPSVTRAVLLVAIPAYALFGWQAYTGWIGTATSAQARQPALDYDEIDAWIGEQHGRIVASQPNLTAKEWREAHPRLTTGSRIIRRPRGTAPGAGPTDLAQLGLRPAATIQSEGGSRGPRGVAASASGEVYLADQNGRLSRLDAQQNALVAIQQRTPPLEQVSDVAIDADGFLYLADAERSVLVKLAPTGELVATLGGDWGMYRPRGIAIGADKRIYVADTGRNRIVIGDPNGRLVRSVTPPGSFGAFEQPTEVAVDESGRIYVGLPEIGRLAILDETGQLLGGWSTPKGNTIESARIAVVADGAIVMTDPAQGKVRLLDADGRELAVADAPRRPYGVAVAGGRVYVSETESGRLLVFGIGP